MKTKLIYIFTLLLAFSIQISAQEMVKRFDNGITVAVMTKTIPPMQNPKDLTLAPLLEKDFDNGKKMNRSILDIDNKLSYDYSLEVSSEENSNKFKVKFKLEKENLLAKAIAYMNKAKTQMTANQDSKLNELLEFPFKLIDEITPMFKDLQNKTLPKYPDEVIVNDGDIIVLDILQDPKSGAKVQDLIRVTRENKPKGFFTDLEDARDFTLNDLQMKLVEAEVFIDGKLANPSIAGVKVPFNDKGSFVGLSTADETIILAPTPNQQVKFEKIGTIEDNKIIFNYKGVKYKIVSKESVLGKAGKWNIWGYVQPTNERAKKLMPPSLYPFLFAKDDIYQNQ